MDFSKLAPWNWFKDEENSSGDIVPIKNNTKNSHSHNNSSLQSMENEFNKLFNSVINNIQRGFTPLRIDDEVQNVWFKPSLDLSSSKSEYVVKLEIPGVESKDIEIEISGSTMKIKGEKKQEIEEKNKDFYRIERSYGSFQRVLNLPEDSDIDTISSIHKDGVLTINIPKKQLPKSEVKKIEIKSH